MRILVLGSCGKKKLTSSEHAPRCADISSKKDIVIWRQKFSTLSKRARDMYIGNQNRELVRGVDALRDIDGIEVILKIISAGFGIVAENDWIPPYDCTFTGMKKSYILARSHQLDIAKDFYELYSAGFDLIYLALGTRYCWAIASELPASSDTIMIGFNDALSRSNMVRIPSDHRIVHALSVRGYKIHGVTGFKGDLLRVLAESALKSRNPYREVLKWKQPSQLRDLILRLSGLSEQY